MNDDLISRKAAVELVIAEYDRFQANGGSHSGRYELDKAIKMLQNMPTAFDKEKVINEIRSGVMAANDEYIETCDEYYHGMQEAHKIDWKIVEKGGIQ